MLITLHIEKTVDQNAALYFEKAKKARRKLEGAKLAVAKAKANLLSVKVSETIIHIVKRKRQWYEKFHWFYSSDGFLCIGGRDATTNDIVIKKHMATGDLVFHTSIAGSPFFIVQADGKSIPETTIKEAAQATASYSRAWKLGLPAVEVLYVHPEQVTKTAQSGEYLEKGAYMIRGKSTSLKVDLAVAIGIDATGVCIGGPVNAIAKRAKIYRIVVQGKEKPSDIAKKIRSVIGDIDLDEIIRFVPGPAAVKAPEKAV